jgi:hypothetical protein
MKNERAMALPLFSNGPHSKQQDVSKMQFLSVNVHRNGFHVVLPVKESTVHRPQSEDLHRRQHLTSGTQLTISHLQLYGTVQTFSPNLNVQIYHQLPGLAN